MVIQSRDLGANRDSVIVLTELCTPMADCIAGTLTDIGHLLNGVLAGYRLTPHGVAEFITACRRELDGTARALRAELDRTALLDCLCVAVLFGQGNGPGGLSPVNAFSYEMELLASAQARIRGPRSFAQDSLQSALRALCLARRRDVVHRYLATFDQWAGLEATREVQGELRQVHNQLADDWTSLRGAFYTRYDWDYSLRLAEQVRRRGGTHPDLTVLIALYIVIMRHRFDVLRRFHAEIASADSALGTVLRDGTLLHLPRELTLSQPAAEVLAAGAIDLLAPWSVLVQAVPEQQRAQAEQWRELLAVQPAALGRNPDYHRIFSSPLAFAPLVQDGDLVLLALPHAISTDLSRLMERVFAGQPSLPYYRARSAAVENEAVRHLHGVFPDARILRGGKYPGTRPGELIEVDGVLVWQDVVVVVESKGGYLSQRARTGDPTSAATELRRTVADGFFQAARLVRALERNHEVTLTDEEGQSLTLDARAIRRIYAVVPTADTFGSVSTTLDLLWQREILPDRATPLIIAIQHLHLLTDLLRTPLELLGYLDYREEILTDPAFRVGDEMEVLGCYVGNTDVIGDLGKVRAEHAVEPGPAILSTNTQERFLDPWISAASTAWLNQEPAPPPPRRHIDADRALIDRLHAATRDTAAATLLHQFGGAHLGAAVRLADEAPYPRRGAPILYRISDYGIVVVNPTESIRAARRLHTVRELRAHSRMLIYLSPAQNGAVLRHAELGRKHVFAGPSGPLAQRSRLGALDPWLDTATRTRHGPHRGTTPADQENINSLVRVGLPNTLALGVTRLGLTTRVLNLADSDPAISLNQAADLYLTHVRRAADALGVHPTELALTTSAASTILRLLTSGQIRPQDAATLIQLAIHDPATPLETLARSNSLLTEHSTPLLDQAVHDALVTLGLTLDDLRRMNTKDRRKTHNRLLGTIRYQQPTANLNTAATYVEQLLLP